MKKFNASKIMNFFRKYKYLIFFICVIILIVLVQKPIREGLESMSIGEYEFLEPPPKNNSWSDETWREFIPVWNNSNGCSHTKGPSCITYPPSEAQKQYFTAEAFLATEKEAKYYVQNGYFPFDGYVKNYLTNNPKILEEIIKTSKGRIKTIRDLQKFLSNRAVFDFFIIGNEEQDNKLNPEFEKSLAYRIALGKAKPPSSSNPLTSSSSNNTYYQDFVSLCKKVTASS